MTKKLSELPVGAKVKDVETMYNGVPIIWQVGGHNHYASSQTVLVSEKIITLKAFDAKEPLNVESGRKIYGNNRYSVSNLRQWLNSNASAWYAAQHSADAPPSNANVWSNNNEYDAEPGFLTNFSANLRNGLITTSIITAKNTKLDGGGSEVVRDKVFLLSNTEVGLANENNIAEGKLLPLFSNDISRVAYPTAEAVMKSEYKDATNLVASKPWYHWLRSSNTLGTTHARSVNTSGELNSSTAYTGSYGVRPSINLPSDTSVSDAPDSDGAFLMFRDTKTFYLFSQNNTAYTIENSALKSLGTITTANASTLFKSGVEAITKEDCTLVGQQLGKAKIIKMEI